MHHVIQMFACVKWHLRIAETKCNCEKNIVNIACAERCSICRIDFKTTF